MRRRRRKTKPVTRRRTTTTVLKDTTTSLKEGKKVEVESVRQSVSKSSRESEGQPFSK